MNFSDESNFELQVHKIIEDFFGKMIFVFLSAQ